MAQSTWRIDPVHTSVQFTARHMMITNVRGVFSKSTGTVLLDENDFTKSQVKVEIDTSSVDTREPKRDDHLRSADFLDVAKFPTMTFQSTRIVPAGDGYQMTGDITLHGVTRPITLNVEPPSPATKDPWGGLRRGFEASGELNRKEFGLVYNQALETGGVLVGEKIKISLEVQLVKAEGGASSA